MISKHHSYKSKILQFDSIVYYVMYIDVGIEAIASVANACK